MDKELSVRLYGKEVGILRQDSSGRLNFTYSDNAEMPVSYSLPLDKKIFHDKECRPYFNGLLPESETVRKAIGKIFGINAGNDFSILQAIGHDCAGALSLHNINEPSHSTEFIDLEGEPQSEESVKKHIEELPQAPFFTDKDNEIRLSLAGAQNKAAVSVIDGKICFPKNGSPTTHILKPIIKELKDTVFNEYLCMKTAKAIGITVPDVEIRKAKDMPYFLIERYDREIKGNAVKRIHQEDFCQALGIMSIDKYQASGGPGLKECFEVLNITKIPAKGRKEFVRLVMFNYLIGNNDAHGKNFSLLYVGNKPVLAPAYDLLSTEAYPKLTKKMAMKVGSSYEKEWVNQENWKKLCEDIKYSFPVFKREFMEMAKILPERIANMKSFSADAEDIFNAVFEAAEKNCSDIVKMLS